MAEVLKRFRDRLQGNKLYEIGDEYNEEGQSQERLTFLSNEGFIDCSKKQKRGRSRKKQAEPKNEKEDKEEKDE